MLRPLISLTLALTLTLAASLLSTACAENDTQAASEVRKVPAVAVVKPQAGKRPAPEGRPTLESEGDKVAYTVGVAVGEQAMAEGLVSMGFNKRELIRARQGLLDAVLGQEMMVDMKEYRGKVLPFLEGRQSENLAAEKKASGAFLEEEASKPGATTTESGIVMTELTPGDGAAPSQTDRVLAHYTASLRDGTLINSTVEVGKPGEFRVDGVLPCWSEALPKMKVGGKSRLVCPSDLAYQDKGDQPQIPGGAAIVFEIELLEILAANDAEGDPTS